ncbi:GNAT family N-acetyltransferase [Shewanella sp. AS16]|uniref:GNAT family N-acetyltransferase n=1 Tax=Shewanella sp. AS16 TaxID=2907625 RepID=UPI001F2122FF|nr:GNAT family N-acetyltransferase [Shewanella sp. AS16]MCE9687437.1 GNAT family N-acetyltransferase [Shewanella sp. AS16]
MENQARMLSVVPDWASTYHVREAKLDDVVAMASVTRSSWLKAFQSFLPDPVLKQGTQQHFEQLWRTILLNAPEEEAIIIEDEGEVVACGACGMYRFDYNPPLGDIIKPNAGELYRGYVTPVYQGYGLGRSLLARRLAMLAARGCSDVYTWVYEDNSSARGFFEHLGASIIGIRHGKTMGSHWFREVCYRVKIDKPA